MMQAISQSWTVTTLPLISSSNNYVMLTFPATRLAGYAKANLALRLFTATPPFVPRHWEQLSAEHTGRIGPHLQEPLSCKAIPHRAHTSLVVYALTLPCTYSRLLCTDVTSQRVLALACTRAPFLATIRLSLAPARP